MRDFRRTYRVFGLVLLLIGSACTSAPEPEPGLTAGPDAMGGDSLRLPPRAEFVESGLRLPGRDRASFVEALGEPDSVSAEVVPNRHVPAAEDTIFTLHYPELAVWIHRPGPGGELLSRVEVRANRHLRHPLIGATRSAVLEAFGTPDESADGTLTYYCTSCVAGNDPVRLYFDAAARVNRIRFDYYVD